MMLIFDGFTSIDTARMFGEAVARQHRRLYAVCSVNDSAYLDPFPFGLTEPVVLVERLDEETAEFRHVETDESKAEADMASLASNYGGTFAGT